MFSKFSRYRKLPNIVTLDALGQRVESKDLRIVPEVSGIFSHTIEEVDRLDHLAFKYYKQAKKWWRICDANPEFMSPTALLGKDPMITTRVPLRFEDSTAQPPWAEFQHRLSHIVGVKDIRMEESVTLVEEEELVNATTVTVHVPQYARAIVVMHNALNVKPETLVEVIATVLTDTGFNTDVEVGQPEQIGRIGKKIIIPPNTVS